MNCSHPEYAVVDGVCTLCNGCAHIEYEMSAIRMRLRYGSAAAYVCKNCGAYQLQTPGINRWQAGPYEQKAREAEEMDDV